jgi:hypothetical protein
MKTKAIITLLLASASAITAETPPWQVPIPKTAAEVPAPAPGTVK